MTWVLLLACDKDPAGIETGTVEGDSAFVDEDGDGYGAAEDCDDSDPDIHPGAVEDDCTDPVDYNCDDVVGYADEDGDGWAACEDCDDGDARTNPAGTEVCDSVDNDCDGEVDEDAIDATAWYSDADLDGWGDEAAEVWACNAGWRVERPGDCDDTDEDTFPGAAPNDSSTACMNDDDGDDYGDELPAEGVEAGTDCDDSDSRDYPGASEVIDNGDDEDCDGGDACYVDDDGDGYGNVTGVHTVGNGDLDCNDRGEADDTDDCDDTDDTVYDGATELCDGQVNDCATSSLPADESDADGDDYVECSLDSGGWDGSGSKSGDDCDDSDADVNPGESESCNGTDDDCDSDIDEGLLGSGADCAAEDCAEVLSDQPSATDGTYTLDDGSGSYDVTCEMDIDGGGWTQLTSSHLATLSTSDTREYLYSSGGAFYISPSTTLVWSWSSYQVLEGSYGYASSGTSASSSFSCTDGESGHWGVGCSNGPGNDWKVLPWGGSTDSTNGTCQICQDQPDVFGAGACQSGAQIWVR